MIGQYDLPHGPEPLLRFGPAEGPQLLMLLPLFEEHNRTRAFAVTLLRALAALGIGALLPEMPGQGESLMPTEALRLATLAGLLPAFFMQAAGDRCDAAAIWLTPADIIAHEDSDRLVIAARARLPVAQAERAELVAFRSPDMAGEHVALLIGAPDGRPPLVRLHSECLTGDVLGSLKCDCGPQLDAAIAAIAAHGWGILLYLRQEGRGIGLINKLRAYALQDQGFDTVDANTRLGFAVDLRDFRVAARMLALLGQRQVRLLTNNPEKVAQLERAGISVAERVPHKLPANPHNERYLATKRDRTGHEF